jgi:hypothetical protein
LNHRRKQTKAYYLIMVMKPCRWKLSGSHQVFLDLWHWWSVFMLSCFENIVHTTTTSVHVNTTATTQERRCSPKSSIILQLYKPGAVSHHTVAPIVYLRISPRMPHLRNLKYQLPRSREQSGLIDARIDSYASRQTFQLDTYSPAFLLARQ